MKKFQVIENERTVSQPLPTVSLPILEPSPLVELTRHPAAAGGIRLFLKRDDLLHPQIQGNKWRKLRLLLQKLLNEPCSGIVTFGGPFSNHLHAVAAAGAIFGLKTVGIVRGSAADWDNPTLRFVREQGMGVFPISKKAYDLGPTAPEVASILAAHPGWFVLPEGGATDLAVLGCRVIAEEILAQAPHFQQLFIAVPAGTGSTAAGVAAGLGGCGRVLIFPAAHGVTAARIHQHLDAAGLAAPENFTLIENDFFKKFAAMPPPLLDFVRRFRAETGILLDPIYTSKMMFQLFKMLETNYFPEGSAVVAIHTGGLQGWAGFEAGKEFF